LLFTVGTHTLQSIFTVICSSEHHTHTQLQTLLICIHWCPTFGSTGYLEL